MEGEGEGTGAQMVKGGGEGGGGGAGCRSDGAESEDVSVRRRDGGSPWLYRLRVGAADAPAHDVTPTG